MDGGNEPVCHRIRRPVSRVSALTRETNDTGQSNTKDLTHPVEDVVGLYLDPPDKALVLSVDEKRSYAGC